MKPQNLNNKCFIRATGSACTFIVLVVVCENDMTNIIMKGVRIQNQNQ